MKIFAATAALLLAGAAHAQTPPAQTPPAQPAPVPPSSTLTRDLNSGPPAPAVYLAPTPAPAALDASAPASESEPATSIAPPPAAQRATPPLRPAPTPAPVVAPSRPEAERFTIPEPFVAPPEMQSPRMTPIPTTPSPQPRMVPITPRPSAAPNAVPPASEPFIPPGTAAAPAPTVALETLEAPAPSPPAAPAVTVLDSAARAALPFTADLPPGFEIVTGRPGPDFRIYTIRRGAQSFVMVYAGPASQFPIYSGQMVEAGGRASILATEDGVRHAVEHLFQRPTTPSEVHIWTMSLDGADRNMAEQIAQSVDVR